MEFSSFNETYQRIVLVCEVSVLCLFLAFPISIQSSVLWWNCLTFITSVRAGTTSSVLMHFIYLITRVMFRHNRTSRRSPHPPLPFRIFCFLITLATVNIRFLGNNWPALVATLMTCCTFEITWLDSQLFFLWWTPLKVNKTVRLTQIVDREPSCLTIRRCEKLSGREQPSHKASSSSTGGSCAATTSPSYSRRSRRSIWRTI